MLKALRHITRPTSEIEMKKKKRLRAARQCHYLALHYNSIRIILNQMLPAARRNFREEKKKRNISNVHHTVSERNVLSFSKTRSSCTRVGRIGATLVPAFAFS